MTSLPPDNPHYDLPGTLGVEHCDQMEDPPEGFRVCVTGGREFDDLGFVWAHLDTVHNLPLIYGGEGPIAELGSGCARGVDKLCIAWANANNVPWRKYIAAWDRFGAEAGLIRNEVMLSDFKPDKLLVFPGGTGTTHCARTARKMKIERSFFEVVTNDPFAEAHRWG